MVVLRPLVALTTLYLSMRIVAQIGPIADLPIVDATIAPDGYPRAAVLANGTFPGPLIQGNKGDTFQIDVIDQLTNETMLKTTSIHWHGIFQQGTAWADGPAFVTQCPIASGNSFLYEFTPTGQAGTYWYHSHLATQYCDGLRGPLVIYDPNDPYADSYDVDDEGTIITLADWYHTAAQLGPRFPMGADSTLINGIGRWNAPNGTTTGDLSVITVESGKRYRFRLVSISCDPNYNFTIDGHSMTIIEADGVPTEPLTVDSIQIFAAQRYSFILNATQAIDNYWVRANPDLGNTGYSNGINSAILRYVGATDSEPTTSPTYANPLLETSLRPLTSPVAPGQPSQDPGAVDYALNLNMAFDGTNFSINGATFNPPSVPVLLQILSGTVNANQLLPPGSVYNLPPNSTIQISMPAGGLAGAPHPFHLHGHTFSVIKSAGQDGYNYENPVQRDTVSLGTSSDDNVTIRFVTNNPGPWFLHCHIDWHLAAGLAVVFAEDAPDIATVDLPPPAWDQLCPIYDALNSTDH
ncbi:laccase 2 [Obba rivulosa]|uniref:laccase n=1 Tax=Obba rivulosa TaxID=1052685 RepID=A0A8E2AJT4_9APHY|nr:laccase 2 [Obba rivulosa]